MNQKLHEITGVSIPRIQMPGFPATPTAAFCTLAAELIKKPPPQDMSSYPVRSMKQSLPADGSKAEEELGIEYTPVRIAIYGAVAACRGSTHSGGHLQNTYRIYRVIERPLSETVDRGLP